MQRYLLALLFFTVPTSVSAQADLSGLQDESIEWLQDYIRVNTINPPGNEIAGAQFLAGIFEAEGVDYEIAESAPGRGNIWNGGHRGLTGSAAFTTN